MGATGLEGTPLGRINYKVDGLEGMGIQTNLTITEGDPDRLDHRCCSPPPPEHWQVNHKIPLSSLPEWNGEGKTLINYLTDLMSYSDLDKLMKSDIAQIAPTWFTTYATKDWFTTLPSEVHWIAMSSFNEFILCLREHFMDVHWIDEHTIEYKEMCFWQLGHTKETPLQFIQQCLKYSRFLFSENDENDMEMTRSAGARLKINGLEEEPGRVMLSSVMIRKRAIRCHKTRGAGYALKWDVMRTSWLDKGYTGRKSNTCHVTMLAEANEGGDVSCLSSVTVEGSLPDLPATYSTLDISPDDSQTDDSGSVLLLEEVFYSKAIDNPFNTTRNSKPAVWPLLVSNGTRIIHAIPRRQFPEGHSSLGIRALWMTAHIGSLETPEIEAHLDPGADITLMLQDFLDTLADPPKIQKGVHMWLY
ncbi:hypothetical protein BDN71DRAFT_1429539 [Pleurotus eryngii]|uniref:Peptidase A2 domain-containing protein n=1 Tax=Pleurotus eryngii TaxID=5323 RepID=A0A9P6A346_PLEER|nr:hypothetical protein BDN71DRAFT_1429539 [Pleurotus eryngii]